MCGATSGAGEVSGFWVQVPELDFRPCGRAWLGAGVWALVRLGSSWDHLRMQWVRLRLCWEWGEVGLASWVDLISLVGLVGASVASCWGLSCGQVAWVVRLVPVGNEASSSVTLWRVLGALWEAIWVVAVVGLVGVSWRQVVMVGQVTRLVVDDTVVAMVGPVGSGTLLWVWVAVLVV